MKPDKQMIRRLLPEIEKISDAALVDKVAAVWVRACMSANSGNRLAQVPFYYKTANELLLAHTRKVTRFALALMESASVDSDAPELDRDILIAACLLHDVDKVLLQELNLETGDWEPSMKYAEYKHGALGAMLCREEGLPEVICHLVETHSTDALVPPESYEGVVLHYADFFAADTAFWQAGLPLLLSHRS